MSLTLVHFRRSGREDWGVKLGERLFALESAARSLREFLERDAPRAWELKLRPPSASMALSEVELLSPVTAPCQLICQGKNYVDHILETGGALAEHPKNILFMKASSSLGPGVGGIVRPKGVRLLDYELELGLVIGAPLQGRAIDEDNLHEVIAGVFIANDVSARDVQVPEEQWFRGKSFRTFCPAGPYLCLLEKHELALLSAMKLELKVNGEVRQSASTSQLIHRPAATLNLIAQTFDVQPGDVVLTGTPAGVALQVPSGIVLRFVRALSEARRERLFLRSQLRNPRYLKDGDRVEASITSAKGELDLGVQQLVVRSE